jgi:beta-glucosidase
MARHSSAPRSDRARAVPRDLIATLTLGQKVALLTGRDNFTLPGEPAIGLRGLVMSDGPAGVRGPSLDPADRSSSPPAPVALAACWDPELVERVAAQLGAEARAKGIDVVLGPTLNLARSPYGGRGFEFYGEDPVLAARTAAAYVRGLQSAGVAATAKHFLGNDSETDRWTVDVRMDGTTLRELYLVPFEACVTEADCAMVMAGYNEVNGVTMTEHAELLIDILKEEWGFSGAVVSDWFAARSTERTALAGLDLVMPGPGGPWGDALVAAVERGAVPEAEIDAKLARLLRVAGLVGALQGPEESAAPAKPGPHADREVLREAAAAAFVLLRNSSAILPLDGVGSVTLIGPNAVDPQYQGRGSAEVGIAATVSPAEGLRAALGDRARVQVVQGCRTWESTPLPENGSLHDVETGEPGARLEVFTKEGELRFSGLRATSEATWWDPDPLVTAPGIGRLRLSATYTAAVSGKHRFAVGGIGGLRLEVAPAGSPASSVEGTAPHPADPMVSHAGPFEFAKVVELAEGESVRFEAFCEPDGYEHDLIRFRAGIAPLPEEDTLLAEAVAAARDCEVPIVIVGAGATTESEGYDRQSLALPGRQDELVSMVAAANPRTIVVVNSGMPVLMPWADQVAAIIQAWFPGQEFGHALAAVLLGEAEPGGRLPVTLPRTEAACPVGRAEPVDGVLEYSEGLLVGYRGYDRAGIEPLFPFGHGLGYTSWAFEGLDVPFGPIRANADVELTVSMRNTGQRPGRAVVQAYLSGPHADSAADGDGDGRARRRRPVRVLAGFGAARAEPGEAVDVRVRIPGRVFARWDDAQHGWTHPRGRYTVEVGNSSRDLRMNAAIEIA